MAKAPQQKDQTFARGEIAKKKVFAVCKDDAGKENAGHRARVHKTDSVRYLSDGTPYQRRRCVCDSCGREWYQDGPPVQDQEVKEG